MDRLYLKRWPLSADRVGVTDVAPSSYVLRPDLLNQFESLGGNCELGFVKRVHRAGPSSLFRWATAPLDGIMRGLGERLG